MATTKEFHDYILECLQNADEVSTRKMMGEYLVYCRGRLIGDICDNCLYLKQTPSSLRLLPNAGKAYPYEGSKTLMLMVDCFENTELMRELLGAMFREVPEVKNKKKKLS